jgi:hypothetical protein
LQSCGRIAPSPAPTKLNTRSQVWAMANNSELLAVATVALTMRDEDDKLFQAIMSCTSGYQLKGRRSRELVWVLRGAVRRGADILSSGATCAQSFAPQPPPRGGPVAVREGLSSPPEGWPCLAV